MQVRVSLFAVAAGLMAVAASSGEHGVSDGVAEAVSPSPAPHVRTVMLADLQGVMRRQFHGRVEGHALVDLAFEASGRLRTLDAREGARVPSGHVLAELDPAPFERALRRAELSLAQATRDLQRAETLAGRSVASDVQVSDARTVRDLAEVALREAQDALDDTRIVAPFDALVVDRLASLHELVDPGEAVVRLHDMSEVRIAFDLPERLLAELGDLKAARFEALVAGIDEPIRLALREIRLETGAIGQSYRVSLAVAGDAAATLLPGRSALVRAALTSQGAGRQDAGTIVPPAAIVTLPSGQPAVFVVEEDGPRLRVRQVPVEVAATSGRVLAVAGLSRDAEIVAVGGHLLTDGQEIVRYAGLRAEAD